jgi:hypothetical protein
VSGRGTLTAAQDCSGRLDRKSTRQSAETAKQPLLTWSQQLIAPGDRRIHGLLAFGEIARADGREQDVVHEAVEQILDGQHFDPRGRKLEGERQGIEPSTDGRDGGAVRGRQAKVRLHVPHPLHEQPHGRRAREIGRRRRVEVRIQREWSDGVLALSSHSKRGSAGDQHSEGVDRGQKIHDQWCRVQDLLEIVEHQQGGRTGARGPSAPGQIERRGADDAKGLGNRGRHELGIAYRRQPSEQHTGCASCRMGACELQRHSGLPGSSWPSERDEAGGRVGKPLPERLQLSIAAEQARERQWHRDVGQFIDCRIVNRRPCAPYKGVARRTSQVKGRGQGAHGVDVGSPPLPSLQRAHRMHGQACNRRKLFLRKARSLAECFELCAK